MHLKTALLHVSIWLLYISLYHASHRSIGRARNPKNWVPNNEIEPAKDLVSFFFPFLYCPNEYPSKQKENRSDQLCESWGGSCWSHQSYPFSICNYKNDLSMVNVMTSCTLSFFYSSREIVWFNSLQHRGRKVRKSGPAQIINYSLDSPTNYLH